MAAADKEEKETRHGRIMDEWTEDDKRTHAQKQEYTLSIMRANRKNNFFFCWHLNKISGN